MERILLVEDVDSLREVLAVVLEKEGFQVEAVASAEIAFGIFKENTFSAVLSDFKLPEMNGLELLRAIREVDSSVPFLIMTAYGSIDIAVEAMRLGATDFISKPFQPEDLCRSMKDVIRHRRIVDREYGSRTRKGRRLLSQNPRVGQIMEYARKVSRVDSSVLLLGESGSGKELLARFIHEQSSRKDKPFVAVNCGALPLDLLESEFFGHESGAFTGATQTRIGLFEYATEGTIFLDEIGDMPRPLQVKLLRALQEREIQRIGSNKLIKVNPRIIAATNLTLTDLLDGGKIREDLFYRVAVVTLELPSLRERPEDLELLVNHFVGVFSEHLCKPRPEIDSGAWDVLRRYPWPGNARELENVMERAVILSNGCIFPEHLGLLPEPNSETLDDASLCLHAISERAAREAEIGVILRALGQTSGNKTKAAQLLGVSYKTLLNKVKEYHLEGAS